MLLLKKIPHRAVGYLPLLLSFAIAGRAWACAVCGGATLDKTSDVFVASTMVLSVVPLAAMGSLVYLLVRSYRKQKSLEED